jgi:Uma2 family endonuclease
VNAVIAKPLMTAEELLALPEDGVDRWLIRGQLREKSMTRRNRFHARIEAKIAFLLNEWLEQQPHPRGEVLSGEAGVFLRRNPDTLVGIDVVYIPPQLAAAQTDQTSMIEGAPTLAVEVLSPSDQEEETNEKIQAYLSNGVALIWLVDPHFETVTVYETSQPPILCNIRQTLSADPHLPGFRVPVARIFQG